MTTVRWVRSELVVPPANPKVKWVRSELTGTAVTVPRVRWVRSEVVGSAQVLVAPLPALTDVEPETPVLLNASLLGGGIADVWSWRRVSGPAVQLFSPAHGYISFDAPSFHVNGVPQPCTVVIGVRATIGTTVSPEVTCPVDVLTQTDWAYSGGVWVGQKPIVPMTFTVFGSTFGDEF